MVDGAVVAGAVMDGAVVGAVVVGAAVVGAVVAGAVVAGAVVGVAVGSVVGVWSAVSASRSAGPIHAMVGGSVPPPVHAGSISNPRATTPRATRRQPGSAMRWATRRTRRTSIGRPAFEPRVELRLGPAAEDSAQIQHSAPSAHHPTERTSNQRARRKIDDSTSMTQE